MTQRRLPFGISLTVALVASVATPALAQSLGQAPDTGVPWWRVGGAFVVCVALAVGAAYVLRMKLGGGVPAKIFGGRRRLQVIETVRVTRQLDVCLFKLDETELLLAATPQSATLIRCGPAAADSRSDTPVDESAVPKSPRRRAVKRTVVEERGAVS